LPMSKRAMPMPTRSASDGLKGLTLILSDRTSAHLAEPQAVDVTADELSVYPLLYWPVLETVQEPSEQARGKIAAYMKNGGTIFFDLRTADWTRMAAEQRFAASSASLMCRHSSRCRTSTC
jgi:hypothetical protein